MWLLILYSHFEVGGGGEGGLENFLHHLIVTIRNNIHTLEGQQGEQEMGG